MTVGVWLVFHGWDGPTTQAERSFGMGAATYRRYLDTLNDDGVKAELADAERVLFTGRSAVMREREMA